MTLEQMLAILAKYKPLTKDVPTARTSEQLKEKVKDPEFMRRRREGAAYRKKIRVLNELQLKYAKNQYNTIPISRFIMHNLREEKTPEDVAYNQDMMDMLYCNEGIATIADQSIKRLVNAGLTMGYVDDLDQAADLAFANPGLAEMLMVPNQLLDDCKKAMDMNPLVYEQLSNAKTAMQLAGYNVEAAQYYGSGLSLLFEPGSSAEIAGQINDNAYNNGKTFSKEDRDLVVGNLTMQAQHDVGATDAWKRTVAALKQEGKLGPNAIFWRTFDATGKRIPLDAAITAMAENKEVHFVEMSPEEKVTLRKALEHPTTPKYTNPGPTAGKGLQQICAELYNDMKKVDGFYISSPEFRNLKAALKEMAGRKTSPNPEEAKTMLHSALELTSRYMKDKVELAKSGPLSQTTSARLAVIKKVHSTLGPKLGVLAHQSYVSKYLTRQAVAENQQKMTAQLNEQEAAEQAAKEAAAAEQAAKEAAEKKMHDEAIAKARAEAKEKRSHPWWGELPEEEAAMPGMEEKSPFGRLAKQGANGIAGIRRNLQPNAVIEPQFTNGFYFAQVLGYNLVAAERRTMKPGEVGPLEKLLNEVGSKVFCKAMQQSGAIRKFTEKEVTPVRVAKVLTRPNAMRMITKGLHDENFKVQLKHTAHRIQREQARKAEAAAAPQQKLP